MELRAGGFRISLMTLRAEDASDLAGHASDPEITRNVARFGEFPYPYTTENALSFINSLRERQSAGSELHFGITLKGRTIGACALLKIDGQKHGAEIGYWIGRKYWGMGYAKEALMLLLGFGFSKLGLNTVSARTFRFNERSIKLLKSTGFSEEAPAPGERHDDELEYRIHKKDYLNPTGFEAIDE